LEACHGGHENDCQFNGADAPGDRHRDIDQRWAHFPDIAKQIGNDPGLIFVSCILLLVTGLAIVRVHAFLDEICREVRALRWKREKVSQRQPLSIVLSRRQKELAFDLDQSSRPAVIETRQPPGVCWELLAG